MKILGLDVSTSCGFALFEAASFEVPPEVKGVDDLRLLEYGVVKTEYPLKYWLARYGYPNGFKMAAESQAGFIAKEVFRIKPDLIVIEETNKAKARYSQKLLEWIHYCLLQRIEDLDPVASIPVYISSSVWRHTLGLYMSKEDKKKNLKLSKAKRQAAEEGVKLDKVKLGIRGRVTKKHIALRWVNENFDLDLKVKDNDIADAIALVSAFKKGAAHADGQLG